MLQKLWSRYVTFIDNFRYTLAFLHALYCMVSPIQACKNVLMIKRMNYVKRNKNVTFDWGCIMHMMFIFIIKYIFNPVIVGLILYGGKELGGESGIRVAIAISIITTSYLFLSCISRFPWVGSYTNMLTKVYFSSTYCSTYPI